MTLLETIIVLYLLAMSSYGVRCAYRKFRNKGKNIMEKIGIEGVEVSKREGRRVDVRFIEKGTDQVLFTLSKNLVNDGVDVINCRIENVEGKASLVIPLVAEASTSRG